MKKKLSSKQKKWLLIGAAVAVGVYLYTKNKAAGSGGASSYSSDGGASSFASGGSSSHIPVSTYDPSKPVSAANVPPALSSAKAALDYINRIKAGM